MKRLLNVSVVYGGLGGLTLLQYRPAEGVILMILTFVLFYIRIKWEIAT
jgi:hypothetical protein